jgi:hypothetical protein
MNERFQFAITSSSLTPRLFVFYSGKTKSWEDYIAKELYSLVVVLIYFDYIHFNKIPMPNKLKPKIVIGGSGDQSSVGDQWQW